MLCRQWWRAQHRERATWPVHQVPVEAALQRTAQNWKDTRNFRRGESNTENHQVTRRTSKNPRPQSETKIQPRSGRQSASR